MGKGGIGSVASACTVAVSSLNMEIGLNPVDYL